MARPHEGNRIGAQPLVLWMKWAQDLQNIADHPPTEIDMDAADDAELEHWLQGNHMDMGHDGPVTDKEVALAHALLRDHVGRRFGEVCWWPPSSPTLPLHNLTCPLTL